LIFICIHYQKAESFLKSSKNSWLNIKRKWVSSFHDGGYIGKNEDPIVPCECCHHLFFGISTLFQFQTHPVEGASPLTAFEIGTGCMGAVAELRAVLIQ